MDKDNEEEGTQSLFSEMMDSAAGEEDITGKSLPEENEAGAEICSGMRRVGVAASIRKLDGSTSSTLRKTQVINQVSDVVRELVENSVDSDATSVQVHLTNFGLDKIEVKDNGYGITASQFCNAISGGYTSKLMDVKHLSSQSFYGFRGEALASICSVSGVSITTKTAEDVTATKYELDNKSLIISQMVVAGGNGTIVVASNLFQNYPVRRLWIKDKKKCIAELRDVETFLKSVAIANPQTHVSLYHNSSLIWNKASVLSMDQALVTVLGHYISKNLQKCGPIDINILPEGEEKSEDKHQQRTIEGFFLKPPIDMKTLSWTGRKMTFLFVNRKRVVIEECEKLIQRYTVAAIDKPAPADARRFPAAVVNINVPADEVDFNREMDKSKVFLVNKDLVLLKLEELLQTFYGITETSLLDNKPSVNKENEPESVEVQNDALQDLNESDRNSTIKSFLENVPTVSNANFSQSPMKNANEGTVPIFPSASSPVKNSSTMMEEQVPTPKTKPFVSNFDLNWDDLLKDTPPEDIVEVIQDQEPSRNVQQQPQPVVKNTLNETQGPVFDSNLLGRIPNSHGGVLQNVNIVKLNHPPSSSSSLSSPVVANPLNRRNAFDHIGSGLGQAPITKRPKLFNNNDNRSSAGSSSQLGMSFSGTARQVTLEHYENWDTTATSKRKSSSSSEYRFDTSPVVVNNLRPPRFTPSSTSTPTSSSRIGVSPASLFSKPIISPMVRNKSFSDVTPRIPTMSSNLLWDRTTMKQGMGISKDNNNGDSTTESGNCGTLLGCIDDMYTAKINDIIGVFHPMNMLQEFPRLKFELNIEVEKVAGRYVVSRKGCVLKLFNQFLLRTDPMCNDYPKIFHKMTYVNNIQGTWLKNLSKFHNSSDQVQEETQPVF